MPADTPLVGRSRDLAALEAVLRDAAAGHGAVAVVLGDGGIGKTSLVAAAATAAHRDLGTRVVRARAREGGGAPGLHVGPGAAGARRGFTGGAPVPHALRGAVDGPGPVPVVRAAHEPLARRCRQGPTVVVLEDWQWADADSRDLLEFLAPDVVDTPVLVLVTGREAELHRLPRADLVLHLRGLAVPEVSELIARVTGATPARDVAEWRRHEPAETRSS